MAVTVEKPQLKTPHGPKILFLQEAPAFLQIAIVPMGQYYATLAKPRPSFYFIGDSITQKGSLLETHGWIALMQEHYVRSVDMINRGLSGWNTRWFLERALPVSEAEMASGQFAPAFITLWFGANDAALLDGDSAKQHVPQDEYRSNLVKILHRLRTSAPQAKILLITPPAVDDATRRKLSKTGKLDRCNTVTGEYAKICVEVAETENAPVIDLHTLFNTFHGAEFTAQFVDGLHFSQKGNRVVFEHLRKKIIEVFGEEAAKEFEKPLIP